MPLLSLSRFTTLPSARRTVAFTTCFTGSRLALRIGWSSSTSNRAPAIGSIVASTAQPLSKLSVTLGWPIRKHVTVVLEAHLHLADVDVELRGRLVFTVVGLPQGLEAGVGLDAGRQVGAYH